MPLSEDGYQAILSLKSVAKMAAFVARVVQHMGGAFQSFRIISNHFHVIFSCFHLPRGVVKDKAALEKFASRYAGQSIEAPGSRPSPMERRKR